MVDNSCFGEGRADGGQVVEHIAHRDLLAVRLVVRRVCCCDSCPSKLIVLPVVLRMVSLTFKCSENDYKV